MAELTDPLDDADNLVERYREYSQVPNKWSAATRQLFEADTIASIDQARSLREIAKSLELISEIMDRFASEPIAVAKTWGEHREPY